MLLSFDPTSQLLLRMAASSPTIYSTNDSPRPCSEPLFGRLLCQNNTGNMAKHCGRAGRTSPSCQIPAQPTPFVCLRPSLMIMLCNQQLHRIPGLPFSEPCIRARPEHADRPL